MALRSTVYKIQLSLSDLDRDRFGDHPLTVARHPSETDERMMVRIAAYALLATERLSFGRGLSDVDEPDLVERDLTGAIRTWVEVGLPDARAVRKACGKAERVVVVAYGRQADRWWTGVRADLERTPNLSVLRIDADTSQALAALAERSVALSVTVQDGIVWFATADTTVEWTLDWALGPPAD